MKFSKNFLKAYNKHYGHKPKVVKPTHNLTISDMMKAFKNKDLSECKKHISKTFNHEYNVYRGLTEVDRLELDLKVKEGKNA